MICRRPVLRQERRPQVAAVLRGLPCRLELELRRIEGVRGYVWLRPSADCDVLNPPDSRVLCGGAIARFGKVRHRRIWAVEIRRWPGMNTKLDEEVVIELWLPPGAADGPPIDRDAPARRGADSAPRYRAYIAEQDAARAAAYGQIVNAGLGP